MKSNNGISGIQYMRAHGNSVGPTHRPMLTGLISGIAAALPALAVRAMSGALQGVVGFDAWTFVVVSAALDGDAASWTCYGAGAGANCGGSGDGLPNETGVALPAGRSLTWVVSVPVRADSSEPEAEVGAVLANPSIDAIDTNTLVVLRDGFDEAYPLAPAR